MATELGAKSNGIAFLVAGGIVYEIVAANCSSPQTCELNADKRADTLLKWVHLGLLQSAVFIAAAAMFDKAHAKAILGGGLLAGGIMYYLYWHAKQAGLASDAPPTEDWGPGSQTSASS